VVQSERQRSAGSESEHETPEVERREYDRESLVEREFEVLRVSGDDDADIDAIRERLGRLPPSPEEGKALSPEASGVGTCGSSGSAGSDPGSRTPDFASLRRGPPHFAGGPVLDSPDPPPRE
jgi:hypothetical protein